MFRIPTSLPAGAMVFSTLICCGVPALADSDANDAPAPTPAEIQRAEEEDPKVCKRFKPTGSAITKRFCYRQSTWDRMEKDGQELLRDIKRAPVDAT